MNSLKCIICLTAVTAGLVTSNLCEVCLKKLEENPHGMENSQPTNTHILAANMQISGINDTTSVMGSF